MHKLIIECIRNLRGKIITSMANGCVVGLYRWITWPFSSTKNLVKFHFILLDPKLPHFCAFKYLYTGAASCPFTRIYTILKQIIA